MGGNADMHRAYARAKLHRDPECFVVNEDGSWTLKYPAVAEVEEKYEVRTWRQFLLATTTLTNIGYLARLQQRRLVCRPRRGHAAPQGSGAWRADELEIRQGEAPIAGA